jgi:hypothetical protein
MLTGLGEQLVEAGLPVLDIASIDGPTSLRWSGIGRGDSSVSFSSHLERFAGEIKGFEEKGYLYRNKH